MGAWVLAIDGPAGAGKSAVARRVAEALDWAHLDSGALFRAVAWSALKRRIAPDDGAGLTQLTGRLDLRLLRDGRVEVDGEDVSGWIRDPDVSRVAPLVARHAGVREALIRHQRLFAAREGKIVAEGRDIGTVVFPEATWKVYLDADPEARARRRLRQEDPAQAEKPEALRQVKEAIEARDRADRERAVAPLREAADAWRLDTTGMTLDEVVEAVLARVRSGVPVQPPRESGA